MRLVNGGTEINFLWWFILLAEIKSSNFKTWIFSVTQRKTLLFWKWKTYENEKNVWTNENLMLTYSFPSPSLILMFLFFLLVCLLWLSKGLLISLLFNVHLLQKVLFGQWEHFHKMNVLHYATWNFLRHCHPVSLVVGNFSFTSNWLTMLNKKLIFPR
jgi:hypothetical protein